LQTAGAAGPEDVGSGCALASRSDALAHDVLSTHYVLGGLRLTRDNPAPWERSGRSTGRSFPFAIDRRRAVRAGHAMAEKQAMRRLRPMVVRLTIYNHIADLAEQLQRRNPSHFNARRGLTGCVGAFGHGPRVGASVGRVARSCVFPRRQKRQNRTMGDKPTISMMHRAGIDPAPARGSASEHFPAFLQNKANWDNSSVPRALSAGPRP
jgi:hypothetical protein